MVLAVLRLVFDGLLSRKLKKSEDSWSTLETTGASWRQLEQLKQAGDNWSKLETNLS
jgi:hypothetical protein